MELNLLKLHNFSAWRRSRFTRQALLLLGGAFVFIAFLLLHPYKLVLDTSPIAPPRSEIVLSILRHDELFLRSDAWQNFKNSLPEGAQAALSQAILNEPATLFAVRDDKGLLQWGLAEALNSESGQDSKPRKRLVRHEVDATGVLVVNGQHQPFQAYFQSEKVRFEIGRVYRGISLNHGRFTDERRLNKSIHQESIRLEKPSGVVWGKVPELIQMNMLRLQELTTPWSWPGRVELAISASSTGETLNPFLLFYKPSIDQKSVAKQTEDFAKNLLAHSSPQTVLVNLPDDTEMAELRHDPEALKKEVISNQFGNLLRFTSPGKTQKMLVFQANDGEVWVSNDLDLIKSGFLENIQAPASVEACERDSIGGFASFPGQKLNFGNFSKMHVSINNLETGLFTLCGYY